jgi:hypothetical protein
LMCSDEEICHADIESNNDGGDVVEGILDKGQNVVTNSILQYNPNEQNDAPELEKFLLVEKDG